MSKEDNAITSQRLREAMELRKLRQADLARITGINPVYINRYVKGEYCPKVKTVMILAKALNVNPDWLCGFTDEMDVSSLGYERDRTIGEITQLLMDCTLEQCQKALNFIKEYIL